MPISPTFDPNDITRDLERRHRDAMLDLVLAWGSLDGALGMLLSRVLSVPFDEGAERYGKLINSAKLEKVWKALRKAPSGENAACKLKKYKESYERHSLVRNRIAHSHCGGFRTSNRDFIVFMKFEKVGHGELAIYEIPIQEMERATLWGREMTALALRVADAPSAKA